MSLSPENKALVERETELSGEASSYHLAHFTLDRLLNAARSALPVGGGGRGSARDGSDAHIEVRPEGPHSAGSLAPEQVEWVVNDIAELGVKIGDQFFWLYKGRSLVYDPPEHDDGAPMHWRPVFKREFGECAHPINYADPRLIGTVSLEDSEDWAPLHTETPAEPISSPPPTVGVEELIEARAEAFLDAAALLRVFGKQGVRAETEAEWVAVSHTFSNQAQAILHRLQGGEG